MPYVEVQGEEKNTGCISESIPYALPASLTEDQK